MAWHGNGEAHDNINQIPLEYDDEAFDDADSTLGNDGVSTQTHTLASSVYNYRKENGRTYQ